MPCWSWRRAGDGFLVLLGAGGAGLAMKRSPRGAAIAGAVGCLLTLATEGVREGLMGGGEGTSTAIGGKLLFLAAVTGLVASIVGAVKPEQAWSRNN